MKIRVKNKIYESIDKNNRYYEDVKLLKDNLNKLGFSTLSDSEIIELWDEVSDKYSATWLIVPESIEVFKEYLESIEVE